MDVLNSYQYMQPGSRLSKVNIILLIWGWHSGNRKEGKRGIWLLIQRQGRVGHCLPWAPNPESTCREAIIPLLQGPISDIRVGGRAYLTLALGSLFLVFFSWGYILMSV